MQKNRAKSVILPHKHRINNVPGRKGSFSQHTVGLFPWAHCKPTNADVGGPPMWHKHIWRSVRKEEKSKPRKITAQGREIHAVFFFFFLASYNASFTSAGQFGDRPHFGSRGWFIASWVWSNYKTENIHKTKCFIITGHAGKMDVSLITSIKTVFFTRCSLLAI